jgi:hypothetical protein
LFHIYIILTPHAYAFKPKCFVEEMTVSDKIRHLFSKSKQYLVTLNVFPSIPPSTDEHELRTQRISTILFIVLTILSMTILLLYTSLIKITKTVNIEAPSFAEYSLLNLTYSETLTCSCSKISINYKEFLHVEYTLHQVCNSIFVNQSWIDYLAELKANTIDTPLDFRHTGSSAFQALKTFCELMNKMISSSLTRFYSEQYVSGSVIKRKLFESETRILVDKFRLSMTNNILLSLSMILNMTQANALLSALKTSHVFSVTTIFDWVVIVSQDYGDCQCAASFTCTSPSHILELPNPSSVFIVPGFYTGCYVIESLLQSTLECFFNQECIDQLQAHASPSSSMNVPALNASLLSLYTKYSTIQGLLDNLMIEQWNVSIYYEQYYNQCQPTQCTYTFQTRNDLIYIVTTLFGRAGGLTTVLKFILPRLVKIFKKKRQEQQASTGKMKSKITECTISEAQFGRTKSSNDIVSTICRLIRS